MNESERAYSELVRRMRQREKKSKLTSPEFVKNFPVGSLVENENEEIATTHEGRVYDDPSDPYVAVKDINGNIGAWGMWNWKNLKAPKKESSR